MWQESPRLLWSSFLFLGYGGQQGRSWWQLTLPWHSSPLQSKHAACPLTWAYGTDPGQTLGLRNPCRQPVLCHLSFRFLPLCWCLLFPLCDLSLQAEAILSMNKKAQEVPGLPDPRYSVSAESCRPVERAHLGIQNLWGLGSQAFPGFQKSWGGRKLGCVRVCQLVRRLNTTLATLKLGGWQLC